MYVAKLLVLTLALLQVYFEPCASGGTAKYRCNTCKSHKLYRKPFAYVTKGQEDRKTDKVKLNRKFFKQSRCEEEGNFAHPLGNCRKFLHCKKRNRHPRIQECRPGTTFDPFTRECEDELNARDCKACNRPHGYKIPHEKGGRKFYMCQDGAAYEFECLGAIKFNPHTRTCGNTKPIAKVEEIDGSYVPGSVKIRRHRHKRLRLATGLMYDVKPRKGSSSEEKRNKNQYREIFVK